MRVEKDLISSFTPLSALRGDGFLTPSSRSLYYYVEARDSHPTCLDFHCLLYLFGPRQGDDNI